MVALNLFWKFGAAVRLILWQETFWCNHWFLNCFKAARKMWCLCASLTRIGKDLRKFFDRNTRLTLLQLTLLLFIQSGGLWLKRQSPVSSFHAQTLLDWNLKITCCLIMVLFIYGPYIFSVGHPWKPFLTYDYRQWPSFSIGMTNSNGLNARHSELNRISVIQVI